MYAALGGLICVALDSFSAGQNAQLGRRLGRAQKVTRVSALGQRDKLGAFCRSAVDQLQRVRQGLAVLLYIGRRYLDGGKTNRLRHLIPAG